MAAMDVETMMERPINRKALVGMVIIWWLVVGVGWWGLKKERKEGSLIDAKLAGQR